MIFKKKLKKIGNLPVFNSSWLLMLHTYHLLKPESQTCQHYLILGVLEKMQRNVTFLSSFGPTIQWSDVNPDYMHQLEAANVASWITCMAQSVPSHATLVTSWGVRQKEVVKKITRALSASGLEMKRSVNVSYTNFTLIQNSHSSQETTILSLFFTSIWITL